MATASTYTPVSKLNGSNTRLRHVWDSRVRFRVCVFRPSGNTHIAIYVFHFRAYNYIMAELNQQPHNIVQLCSSWFNSAMMHNAISRVLHIPPITLKIFVSFANSTQVFMLVIRLNNPANISLIKIFENLFYETSNLHVPTITKHPRGKGKIPPPPTDSEVKPICLVNFIA
jgi:hypothetical protein